MLAAAAGVGWGLAGADPGTDAPGAGSGVLAGDAEPGRDQPDPDGQPGIGEPAGGGGLPGGGSGSGPVAGGGSGAGSGSSGGGPPGNQPPVIDDMGLSSDGLTLRIVPTVSDPDGGDVSLAFEVDGERPLISEDGSSAGRLLVRPGGG